MTGDTPHQAAPAADPQQRLHHIGGFVLGGVLALLVDISVLRVLTDLVGLSALAARPISIAIAMLASWWVNRTMTFAVKTPARLDEFLKFAAVSWIAQAVNYAVFSAILIARPATMQEVALVAACGISMVVAYFGFRFGVFRGVDKGQNGRGKT